MDYDLIGKIVNSLTVLLSIAAGWFFKRMNKIEDKADHAISQSGRADANADTAWSRLSDIDSQNDRLAASVEALAGKISALHINLAEKYVLRTEFQDHVDRIHSKLDRILDKMDQKADK